ncbi:hypothetical protein RND71_026725 [Anisodus tanguticus]|uniref:Uncharacterized protein n=1 Tax=Anisodus tanguticus TaxID=243964 RepID=A0AAE1RP66_9SOLA|nr:hypothetical protein RND71_026725 [Anisodus tanguticus]
MKHKAFQQTRRARRWCGDQVVAGRQQWRNNSGDVMDDEDDGHLTSATEEGLKKIFLRIELKVLEDGAQQPRKIIAELATEFCQKSALCYKCSENHQWFDCQAGKYFSYDSSYEKRHFVSSAYMNDVSYEHNSNSEYDKYPNYDWNISEVIQPLQEENGSLEELMCKFIDGVEERFTKIDATLIQNDVAIENLTKQMSQLETPCENEPTQEDEHLEREVATLQDDSDSIKMIKNEQALADCEAMEEEFKTSSTLSHLQPSLEEKEKQMFKGRLFS